MKSIRGTIMTSPPRFYLAMFGVLVVCVGFYVTYFSYGPNTVYLEMSIRPDPVLVALVNRQTSILAATFDKGINATLSPLSLSSNSSRAATTATARSTASSIPPPPQTTTNLVKSQGCSFNQLDPFHPATVKLVKTLPPLDCSQGLPSLVYVEDDRLLLDTTKVRDTVGVVGYCRYTPLRLSTTTDSWLEYYQWSGKFLIEPVELSDRDEHLLVECYHDDQVVAQTFKSRLVVKPDVEKRSHENYKRHVNEVKPRETMSVMIVGIDGMSKQNLVRTMPKTRDYILKHMNARELHKFNKVGSNTFPNVVAMLTDYSDDGEFKKRFDYTRYHFDDVEELFLWHRFQNAGYRTSMGFDVTKNTAFHSYKRGWKRPTFDYYNRPLVLEMYENEHARKGGDNCAGEMPQLEVLQDYLLQLTATFNNTRTRPYFVYNFYTLLTHDDQNEASRGDDVWLRFFQRLDNSHVLNNTIVIFFSDHGPRYDKFRKTVNGRIESNTPFVFFMFPAWFEASYRDVMDAFATNQNRLTTFFDIHQTLESVLNFTGRSGKGDSGYRGIRLFDEIPVDRTCLQAGIPLEFCNCRKTSDEKVPEQVSQDLSHQLLAIMVNSTTQHRHVCALLTLEGIDSILAMKKGGDKGPEIDFYQVTITARPGGGIFEALMNYDTTTRKSSLIDTIRRLNHYRGQDGCMDDPGLKSFCYCTS